jgi:hypothetical protein
MATVQDEIRSAIEAHGLWKARLKAAIESGSCETPLQSAEQEGECPFGRWLCSEGAGARLQGRAEYRRCQQLHREFHRAAGDVLALALSGWKEDALQAIAPHGRFGQISASLIRALTELDRAASANGHTV